MDLWEKCVEFHGHRCGGLRIGYAAAMSFVILILVATLSAIETKVGDKR